MRTAFGKVECLINVTQGTDKSALDTLVHEGQPVRVYVDMILTLGWQADTGFAFSSVWSAKSKIYMKLKLTT